RAPHRLLHRHPGGGGVRRRLHGDQIGAPAHRPPAHARPGSRALVGVEPGMTRVTLIGLGEVGTVFAEDLAAGGHTDLVAWATAFADRGGRGARAAAALPVAPAESAGMAARGAGLVVSAVTAANCHQAAAAAAPGLDPGAWFFDLNSSSPGHKQQAARAVEQAGRRYVEAAPMSPIAPPRPGSPLLRRRPHPAGFPPAR